MKKAFIAAGVFVLDAITIISFYMAFKDIKTALLWSLPILIGCLLVIIVSLCFQLHSLNKEIQAKEQQTQNEIDKREQLITSSEEKNQQLESEKAVLEKQVDSLILQNKVQREKLLSAKNNWDELNQIFLTALQGRRNDRFEEAYKFYLIKTNILFSNDKEVF